MSTHIKLGKSGEDIAGVFLEGKGHRLLERNFRCGRKEIDIISLDGDVLVFAEIKSRSGYDFGFPEEAVSSRKQAFLKTAAEAYLSAHPEYEKIRFDVVSLLMRPGQATEIFHIEDAFY